MAPIADGHEGDAANGPPGSEEPRSRRDALALTGAGVAAVAAVVVGGAGYLAARQAGVLPGQSSGLRITVNGRQHAVRSEPKTPLLYVLRDEMQLQGPRFGCGLGQCGACTVHMDGVAIRSCITPVQSVGSRPIVTLEGLGTLAKPHPVQAAFINSQAMQCGYCANGWIMTAAAYLSRHPKPTEVELRTALAGLVCRCGTHTRILQAVRSAAGGGA